MTVFVSECVCVWVCVCWNVWVCACARVCMCEHVVYANCVQTVNWWVHVSGHVIGTTELATPISELTATEIAAITWLFCANCVCSFRPVLTELKSATCDPLVVCSAIQWYTVHHQHLSPSEHECQPPHLIFNTITSHITHTVTSHRSQQFSGFSSEMGVANSVVMTCPETLTHQLKRVLVWNS